MVYIKNPLNLYKYLPRTNCRDCGISTCLAFAAAVLKAEKKLSDCPHLSEDIHVRLDGKIERQANLEAIQEESLKELQKEVRNTDLPARASLLGGEVSGIGIKIRCLGKEFMLDADGKLVSQCHTHAWFSVPFLNYVLYSAGLEPAGRWVPLRELEGGSTWAALFEQRCERPLKELADRHGELFSDLVSLFSGSTSFKTFDSDIAVVLYPLPKVPVLICYWKPEDGMGSRLHVFFDDTAEKNLPLESLFTLGTGIVQMLEKIMQTHTDAGK